MTRIGWCRVPVAAHPELLSTAAFPNGGICVVKTRRPITSLCTRWNEGAEEGFAPPWLDNGSSRNEAKVELDYTQSICYIRSRRKRSKLTRAAPAILLFPPTFTAASCPGPPNVRGPMEQPGKPRVPGGRDRHCSRRQEV
ncbi:hypothetical protein K438DRAFT_1040167 [Mycena galopus ATCC 62051]|nr:hypothetical protein K438DRAFT_1040167 [Mycena galopus ATCC 62051]